MARVLRGMLVVGLLGLGVASARFGYAEGDAKCTIATKGDSATAKACAEGGIPAAKKTMKEMVKTAKANGTKFDCDDCHKEGPKFELTSDARDKFKKLLAAQTK